MKTRRPVFLALACAIFLAALSGCTSDAPSTGSDSFPQEAPTPLRLEDGWTQSTQKSEFTYDAGAFRANFEGDQLLLELDVREDLDLSGLTYTLEGRSKDSDGDTISRHFALWKSGEAWPRWEWTASFVSEFGTVTISQGDVSISQAIVDPQEASGTGTRYRYEIEHRNQMILEPGTWRLWLGVARAAEMKISIELPEIDLVSAPTASPGCDVVRASEHDSRLVARMTPAGGVAKDARFSVDVPAGSLLKAIQFTGAAVVGQSDKTVEFPSGETWTATKRFDGRYQTDPQGWTGYTFTSETPGAHAMHTVQDIAVGGSGSPKVIYCII